MWENIAAAQYKLDGDDAGWDSEESDHETEDDKYIKVRPMACCIAEHLWHLGRKGDPSDVRMQS